MVVIIGTICNIFLSNVQVQKFMYEECLKWLQENPFEPISEAINHFQGPKLTLKFSKDVADGIVELAGHTCKITIKDGLVISVERFDIQKDLLENQTRFKAGKTPPPTLAREEVLSIIVNLQREKGIVEEGVVLDEAAKRGIPKDIASKIISQLLREAVVYRPRDGFLKAT
jgi:DNA replicative helicase MCM subunit Mcm2 (Cdc46/Mcm family)